MAKIKIGLYKHKETGQFDVMIDEIDNSFNIHNGEFDKVKQFEYYEKTREDILREECEKLQTDLHYKFDNHIKPIFYGGKTSDFLDDKKINNLRDVLYQFMCKRRELLKVDEYEYLK